MVSIEEVRSRMGELSPEHLEVVDESDGCGAKFRIEIVSDQFKGLTTLKCHRLVQERLADLMQKIHAVTIKAYDPDKWKKLQAAS